MNIFSDNNNIYEADLADIPALVELLNKAYRGDESRQGWTTEAHLIGGDVRTDAASVQEVIEKENSVLLKYKDHTGLIGCVNLQQHGDRIYLGMFAVSPQLQGGGIGKKLLNAAEEFAFYQKCKTIYMTVISVRTELLDWYKRHGYKDTGERRAFEEDGLTGNHLQSLDFTVLEKDMTSLK